MLGIYHLKVKLKKYALGIEKIKPSRSEIIWGKKGEKKKAGEPPKAEK